MANRSNKLDFINETIKNRKEESLFRELHPIEPNLATPEILIDGQKLINFCSNDYLGLSSHPEVIERSRSYLENYGAGASSSRLISGTLTIHDKFEQKLAEVFGFESVLLFNSGFLANISIIAALADRNSLILIDKKCHNSLVQGSILSRAKIKRYRHNDYDHLKSLLEKSKNSNFNRVLIISESVFSMDGDRSDIDELIKLAKSHDAFLYSDDAHALGVIGEKGLGINYAKKGIDLAIGTFGKSFGGFGAFVGCNKIMRDYLINKASGFIYTTALPPAVIGSLDAALDLIPEMNAERDHIHTLTQNLKRQLRALNFKIGESDSQIIPIIIGEDDKVIDLSNQLKENGLWVSAVRPPTVESGTSRLRITITAHHKLEHIDQLILALKEWKHD